MRNTRLTRTEPAAPTTEPMTDRHEDALSLVQPRLQEMTGDLEIALGYNVSGDRRESDAVFGLIGAPVSARTRDRQPRHGACDAIAAGDTDQAQDVMQVLHNQYWRALDDPHASLADHWAGQSATGSVLKREPSVESPDVYHEQHGGPAGTQSIDAILSGTRVLEDVFGPLRQGEVPEPEPEPVPEILRLFASPEYRAAVSRRIPALAPTLSRREHHSLSIDSPLPVPAPTSVPGQS